MAKDSKRSMKDTLEAMIVSLRQGETPAVSVEEFSCFSPKALADQADISPNALDDILSELNEDDIPTLERAISALDEATPAWLGFKIVTDAAVAVDSEDTDVVGIRGKGEGSADGKNGMFFANEEKEIVFSRHYSDRDMFQMLDITRGPHMHNEQYAGVSWLSIPLQQPGKAFIFGAGEVPLWVARMAHDVDFETVVIDDDASYLNEERFPLSKRVLIDSWSDLPELGVTERDYVLVLSRGHMHDPETLIYGIESGAQYVGMMGCAMKNERVFEMAKANGVTTEQIEATHSPIGLKFGAKTPPELAMCVVAEMIQVRSELRKTGGAN